MNSKFDNELSLSSSERVSRLMREFAQPLDYEFGARTIFDDDLRLLLLIFRLKYSVTFWRSILMGLYSPVDLTGNVNMIEKLVLGGTGTGDLPILSQTR